MYDTKSKPGYFSKYGRYLLISVPILLRTMIDHQVWQYKDEGKVWMLQTGLPKLGQ